MSVLVEAISVIVRRETLDRQYPGGVEQYARNCPNQTFCADRYLTRVGFMDPQEVRRFVGELERCGIEFIRGGSFADIAVADQITGPTAACAWLSFDKHPDGYAFCWLKGTRPDALAVPAGWVSGEQRAMQAVSDEDMKWRLQYLRSERNMDVFRDALSGRELYLGHGERDAQSWCAFGVRLEQSGDLEGAVRCHDAALQLDPGFANAWYCEGVTLLKLDRAEEALECFARCTEIDAAHERAWANLGGLLSEQGRHDEGLRCLEKAVELAPDDPLAWWHKALSERSLGRRQQAIRSLEHLVRLEPDQPTGLLPQALDLLRALRQA